MIMIKGNNLCFPFGHLYVKVICHLKMRSVEQNLTKSLAKVKVTDGFQSLHSKRLSAVSGTINLEREKKLSIWTLSKYMNFLDSNNI